MSLLSPLVPVFPNNLTNGTPADASQVMADFNTLRNAINNTLNATGATGGDQYVGLTTDSRFNGTSVHDALTQLIDRQTLYTDTGATNALVITPTPAMSTLAAGQVFWFKPANTTTSGSATINISGLGVVGLANQDGTLLLAGMLIAGSSYMAVTAGPGNPVRVINPSRVTSSFTLTISTAYLTVQQTGTINLAVEPSGKFFSAWAASSISGTSNSTSMQGTGVPSIIQTLTQHFLYAELVDSNAGCLGGVNTGAASGNWVFNKNGVANGFTASSVKGLLAGFTVSGPLD